VKHTLPPAGIALAFALLSPALAAQTWSEETKLIAPNPASGDTFGFSVALDGDTALIGANGADPGPGLSAGQAHVFVRSGTTWVEQALLSASDGSSSDRFGAAVALSGDTAVVGAPFDDNAAGLNAGSTYVFVRNGTTWSEQGRLVPLAPQNQAEFGTSVAIEGDTAVVGAYRVDLGVIGTKMRGLAFDASSGTLYGTDTDSGMLLTIDPVNSLATVVGPIGFADVAGLACDASSGIFYGSDLATRQLIAIDPATGAGAAVVSLLFSTVKSLAFDPGTNTVYGADTSTDKLVAIDPVTGLQGPVGSLGFGSVRGLAFDPGTGFLYGTDKSTKQLVRIDLATGAGTAVGDLGAVLDGLAFRPGANALSGCNNLRLVEIDPATASSTIVGLFGAFDTGAAYVFRRSGTDWAQEALLSASTGSGNDWLGQAVALSNETLVVGAAGSTNGGVHPEAAYVFVRNGTTWSEQAKLESNTGGAAESFGRAVSVSADTLAVGAYRTNNGLEFDVGAAHVFTRAGSSWTRQAILLGEEANDELGISVAVNGDQLVAGAHRADDAGAAYVYARNGTQWSTQDRLQAGDPGMDDRFGRSVALANGRALAGAHQDAHSGGLLEGSAYVFTASPGCTTCVSYCTAGTSAAGCRALLSALGVPSASASSGFDLVAEQVEGGRNGLFYYGANGRQANPWGNGASYQCVVPPVTRAALMPGVGVGGQCNGTFVQDLNALWSASPPKNPGAGAVVRAQLWYRDPFNSSNTETSLSDALEFTAVP
jgi:hypothetical protein